MPHLFSGLHQKRQGGKVTSGTINIGSTKSRGSASRMVSHCSKSSNNITECIKSIMNIKKDIIVNEIKINNKRNNNLFNRDTFFRYFNIYSDGSIFDHATMGQPFLIPPKYITALNAAVDRWAMFLQVDINATYFIYNNLISNFGWDGKNWNGIELNKFKINTTSVRSEGWIARCGTIMLDKTSFVIGFTLEINYALLESGNYNNDDIENIFAHELGHALGISSGVKSYNDKGSEIQPLLVKANHIQEEPYVLRSHTDDQNNNGVIGGVDEVNEYIFPNLIWEYDKYGGVIWKGGYRPPGSLWKNDKGIDKDIDKDIDKGIDKLTVRDFPYFIPVNLKSDGTPNSGHWLDYSLTTKNWDDDKIPDSSRRKILYAGIENDIMAPVYNPSMTYFISRLSIGRLADLRNDTYVGTIYNYAELHSGSSEVKSNEKSFGSCIKFDGSRSVNYQNINNKNISNDNIVTCQECEPIFTNTTNMKNINNANIVTCQECEPIFLNATNIKKYFK